MSTLLRHLLPRAPLRQTRQARIVNTRFYQSSIPLTVQQKYQQKLDEKLKATGAASLDELKTIYAERIAAVKKEAAVPIIDAVLAGKPHADAQTPFNPPPAPTPTPAPSPIAAAAKAVSSAPPGVKNLDSYINVAALAQHDATQIELLWRARFVANGKSLCGVTKAETYARMAAMGKKYPMFLLPLAREGQGVEMHLLQWTFPHADAATVLFTSLAEYKLRGEFASPHTTLTHHTELAGEKGVVLVQGAVVGEGVTVSEAGILVLGLQRFYGALEDAGAERRRGLVEMFGKGDEGFNVQELIEEAEKIV